MRIYLALIVVLTLSMSCNTSKELSSHNDFHKRKYLKGKYQQSLSSKRTKAPFKTTKADPVFSDSSEDIALEPELRIKDIPENRERNIQSDEKIESSFDERGLTAMIKDSPFFDLYPIQKFKKLKNSRTTVPAEKEDNTVGIIGFTMAMVSILSLILSGISGIGALGGIAALTAIAAFILGLVALKDFRLEPDRYKGRGFALTAVIVGVTYLALTLLAVILLAILFSNWSWG